MSADIARWTIAPALEPRVEPRTNEGGTPAGLDALRVRRQLEAVRVALRTRVVGIVAGDARILLPPG